VQIGESKQMQFAFTVRAKHQPPSPVGRDESMLPASQQTLLPGELWDSSLGS
jgi:hypothetical protein